jgi:hypothetical protein
MVNDAFLVKQQKVLKISILLASYKNKGFHFTSTTVQNFKPTVIAIIRNAVFF